MTGESYLIGSRSERRNIDLVEQLCAVLDEALPRSPHCPHRNLIAFVADRPGHDMRYAIDPSKLERTLGWSPDIGFEDGLGRTVSWYLENADWCARMEARYQQERLGLGALAGGGGR